MELGELIRALPRPTRRALPERDDEIDALPAATRAELARIWAERTKSELGAGSGFAIVVTELYALGADAKVLGLATRAAQDEVKHAELCHLLACAYAGGASPLPMPRGKRVGMPPHRGADETLRAHLHVVGLSCINETIAASFVETCVQHAQAPLVRAIQLEHLSDEIEHARVGWAHLGSTAVDEATKSDVAKWVPRLLKANVTHWRERIAALPEQGVAGHGYPPRPEMLASVDRAVEEVIRPGFSHVGVK